MGNHTTVLHGIGGKKMKLSHLYNLDSMKSLEAQSKDTMFKDSAGGIVLARNLEVIDPRIFEQQYPGLSFINSGISVDNTGGYGNSITKIKLSGMGDFTYAGDKSGNKGKISLQAEDDTIPVFQLESFSEWDDTEIQQASMQNINLVQKYISVTNERYNHKLDEIGYTGHKYNDGTQKSEGLLNSSLFASSTASAAIGTLTGPQMYDEIASLITDQWNGVSNVDAYKANKVSMPTSVFNVLSQTILNSAGSHESVLTALKSNFPTVTFEATSKAEASNLGGTSVTVAWSTNPDAMIMRVPQPLTIGKIIDKGSFAFQQDSKARVGGLDVAESLAGRRLTGL